MSEPRGLRECPFDIGDAVKGVHGGVKGATFVVRSLQHVGSGCRSGWMVTVQTATGNSYTLDSGYFKKVS